jgi:hypothetical protein
MDEEENVIELKVEAEPNGEEEEVDLELLLSQVRNV